MAGIGSVGRMTKGGGRDRGVVAWAPIRIIALFAVLVSTVPVHEAPAGSTGASRNVEVALLSEQTSVQPGRPLHVGLHMKLRPGWHTYWRNPGDAGLPLRIEWALPPGFSAGPIEWPTPARFESGPIVSYGYSREVLISVEITPPSDVPVESVTIAGKFDWLECAEICIPGSASLELALPVRLAPPTAGPAAPRFADARSRMPTSANGWEFAAEAGSRALSLAFRTPPGMFPRRAYLFVDQPLVVDYAAAQGFERAGDRYRLTVPPASGASTLPGRLTGVLVLQAKGGAQGGHTAVEVDVPLVRGDPAPATVPVNGPAIPAATIAAAVALAGLGLVIILWRARRTIPRNPPA